MTTHYIYLIQEREFIKTHENIFKVGKSKQENTKRINQYPKQSKLILYTSCDDCDKLEREVIKIFKNKYKHRKDIGNEYFEGDYEDMIKTIIFTRTNIADIINQEKTEIHIIEEEKELSRQKRETEKKIQEEEKELSRQKRETEKKIQEEEKELLKQSIRQKRAAKKKIQDEEKEFARKQKEEDKIKREDAKLKIKNDDEKQEIKTILDWLFYKVKNNTLTDESVRTLYLSYCDFIQEYKNISMCETKFGILLNNNNKSIPFNIGHKKRTNGCMIMKFDLTTIKKEFNVI